MSESTTARATVDRLREKLEGPNTYGNSKLFWAGFAVAVAAFAAFPLTTDPYTVLQSSRYLAFAFLQRRRAEQ